MKIFGYIASQRGVNSTTYLLSKLLVEDIVKKSIKNISYEILTSADISLEQCKGCLNCFFKGTCPLDNKDGFNNIKKKIIESDLIILGSPVYACMVSGDMKIFIDRLSYFLHLILLSGKPAIIITTSSNSGIRESSSYLKNIVEILGANVICNLKLAAPNIYELLNTPSFKKDFISKHVNTTMEYINNEKVTSSTDFHERYFQACKKTYKTNTDIDNNEYKYWRESGLLNCNSFEDVLTLIRNDKTYLISHMIDLL